MRRRRRARRRGCAAPSDGAAAGGPDVQRRVRPTDGTVVTGCSRRLRSPYSCRRAARSRRAARRRVAATRRAPRRYVERLLPVPVLAYYYIWFDPSSWNRAKSDYPAGRDATRSDARGDARGRSDGEDGGHHRLPRGVEAHPVARRRLATLVERGSGGRILDLASCTRDSTSTGHPLPFEQVGTATSGSSRPTYAARPVSISSAKPVVIWSGTWKFTPSQISHDHRGVRGRAARSSATGRPSRLSRRVARRGRRRRLLLVVRGPGGRCQRAEAGGDVPGRAPAGRLRIAPVMPLRRRGRRGAGGAAPCGRHPAGLLHRRELSQPDALGGTQLERVRARTPTSSRASASARPTSTCWRTCSGLASKTATCRRAAAVSPATATTGG